MLEAAAQAAMHKVLLARAQRRGSSDEHPPVDSSFSSDTFDPFGASNVTITPENMLSSFDQFNNAEPTNPEVTQPLSTDHVIVNEDIFDPFSSRDLEHEHEHEGSQGISDTSPETTVPATVEQTSPELQLSLADIIVNNPQPVCQSDPDNADITSQSNAVPDAISNIDLLSATAPVSGPVIEQHADSDDLLSLTASIPTAAVTAPSSETDLLTL